MNSSNLTDGDLELINRYAIKDLTEDDVFTFSLILCDNEVDRHNERFSVEALNGLADMFVGVTGIRNHSCDTDDQSARIYKTEVLTVPGKITAAGEPYTCIKAFAYMPRSDENAQLIKEIETGIRKETSVGCAVGAKRCSVCGEMLGACPHINGEEYGGVKCHTVLCEPKDAYEWSFVAVPAQRAAGVTKSADGLVEKFSGCTGSGEFASLARFGFECRQALVHECTAKFCRIFEDIGIESADRMFSSLGAEELKAISKALRCGSNHGTPGTPQLCVNESSEAENTEFVI